MKRHLRRALSLLCVLALCLSLLPTTALASGEDPGEEDPPSFQPGRTITYYASKENNPNKGYGSGLEK